MKSFTNKVSKKGISFILSMSMLLSIPMHSLAATSQSSYLGIPAFMTGLKNTMLGLAGMAPKKLTPAAKFKKMIIDLKDVKMSKTGTIITLTGATLTVAGLIALLIKLAMKKKGKQAPNNNPSNNIHIDAVGSANPVEKSTTETAKPNGTDIIPSGTVDNLVKTHENNIEDAKKGIIITNEPKKTESSEVKAENPKVEVKATETEVKAGWFKNTVDYIKAAPKKVWNWTTKSATSIKDNVVKGFKSVCSAVKTAAQSTYKFATTNPFKKTTTPVVVKEEVKKEETPAVVLPTTTEAEKAIAAKAELEKAEATKAELEKAEATKAELENKNPKVVTNINGETTEVPVEKGNTAKTAEFFENKN